MEGMDYLVRLVIRIDESTKANVIAANHFVSFLIAAVPALWNCSFV